MSTNSDGAVPVVEDPDALLRYGVCRVSLPTLHQDGAPAATEIEHGRRTDAIVDDSDDVMGEWLKWAAQLSVVSPEISFAEDGEYAFYRNILDEPNFPFDEILRESSPIAKAMKRYFGIRSLRDEIRLDDAFCIHYNTSQDDTSGSKHLDPSDITVNLCLEKTEDVEGSMVLFHGTRRLAHERDPQHGYDDADQQKTAFKFMVEQQAGYATLHWGNHPHETTPLTKGRRTNIVLTYCYADGRNDTAMRTCYS